MCYFDLNDQIKACETLLTLKDLLYETGDTLSFICLACAIMEKKDDFDYFFHKAKLVDINNINLWVAYFERYKEEKSIEILLQDIPEEALETSQLLFSIGETLTDQGRKKEGIALLNKALSKLDAHSDKINDTKAIIATKMIQDIIDPYKFINSHFSVDERSDLEHAKALYNESWSYIKETELAAPKYFIILNRGVINKITGNNNQALLDFQKAFDLSKEFIPFKNLFMMQLQLQDIDGAEQLLKTPNFKRDLIEEEIYEMDSFKARLLSLQGKFREGIPLLTAHLDETKPERYQDILSNIIAIYSFSQCVDEAMPYCDLLTTKFPELSTGYLFTGLSYLKLGNTNQALKYFDFSASKLKADSPHNEIFELAEVYISLEEHDKAIPLLEKIVDKNLYNNISKGLIYSLYQSGKLQEALSLAQKFYKSNPETPFLIEIISNIYQEITEFTKAVELIEEFLQKASGQIRNKFLIRGARFYSYKKDWENVRRLALQIGDDSKFSMDEMFMLSKLLLKTMEDEKGLDVAFNARNRFFDLSEAHLRYINISLRSKRYEKNLFPSTVRPECAVIIRHESGKEETYLLTDKAIKSEKLLKPTDHFYKAIMGKSVGQELPMTGGYGITNHIVILEVIDIHVYAFRESLNLFETKFMREQNLSMIRVNLGRPDDQFEQVVRANSLERNSYQKQVYNLYKKNNVTIGMLAGLFNRNVVKEWLSLINSSDVYLTSYAHDEQPIVRQAVTKTANLILDITALLTTFFLSSEYVIFSFLENNFIVSQSTIEDLQEFAEELDDNIEDGIKTLEYRNGSILVHHITKEEIQDYRKKIHSIIEWCEIKSKICIPSKLININRRESEERSKILGTSFYHTILLAKEFEGIVVSDDSAFKNFMSDQHLISAFSTYQLAHYLYIQKKLTKKEFEDFFSQLILANNIYIPCNIDQLWTTFETADFQSHKPFSTAVTGLLILTPLYCAGLIMIFLKKLYLSIVLPASREQTVIFILTTISKHRDFKLIMEIIHRDVANEFRFLPISHQELSELMKNFT